MLSTLTEMSSEPSCTDSTSSSMLTIRSDGDPTNNEANDTVFEHNWMSNQFRFGGDTRGLMNNLDYIQGMGIRAIYMTGTPFLNMPWGGDGYGPLDFTLLDRHHGDIADWQALITEIHRRDMYVVFDNVMATLVSTTPYGSHSLIDHGYYAAWGTSLASKAGSTAPTSPRSTFMSTNMCGRLRGDTTTLHLGTW